MIFRVLDALRVFDLIYVLTSNSKDTMSMSVYARQQLVDFQQVGYGSAADEHEGGGTAPAPSATKADLRAGNGRTNTHNNAADFITGLPTPRNSQSAPAVVHPD